MQTNTYGTTTGSDHVQSLVIEIISSHCGIPPHKIGPDTDVVRDLGQVGMDGWRLLDRIAHEFSIENSPSDGTAFYSRCGDEATLPIAPLAFVVSAITGTAVWFARAIGLHKKRIDEVVMWPPSKVFMRTATPSSLRVSEIIDHVRKVRSRTISA